MQTNIASYFVYLISYLATSFVDTPFNPLLSWLHQFINGYTNRNDIHDINVHIKTNL